MDHERRTYEELRVIVERAGGEMHFERENRPQGGAWVVSLAGKTRVFHSNGAGFPELDSLYVPIHHAPRHWTDYTNDLRAGSDRVWLEMLR